MFDKYFERNRVVNQIVDELSFDTAFNNLPDLEFTYEIKNHFLFIRRKSEPEFIVYDFEANTFRIPSVDRLNICGSGHRKRLLKALILAHESLVRRDDFLKKIRESRKALAHLVTDAEHQRSNDGDYRSTNKSHSRRSSSDSCGSPGSSSSRNSISD